MNQDEREMLLQKLAEANRKIQRANEERDRLTNQL